MRTRSLEQAVSRQGNKITVLLRMSRNCTNNNEWGANRHKSLAKYVIKDPATPRSQAKSVHVLSKGGMVLETILKGISVFILSFFEFTPVCVRLSLPSCKASTRAELQHETKTNQD